MPNREDGQVGQKLGDDFPNTFGRSRTTE
ncbi:MAG: hypothetical protein SLRJCFUN_002599 [Candidatus Fervidibacter sp.]